MLDLLNFRSVCFKTLILEGTKRNFFATTHHRLCQNRFIEQHRPLRLTKGIFIFTMEAPDTWRNKFSIVNMVLAWYLSEDKGQKRMTNFTAYFDGSGSPDEGKALVVAGYLATVDQWLEFNREWTECLTSEGVSAFHMRDFAHSLREFATWKGDEPRRRRFLERLIRIVKMRVRKSIANAVLLDAYNSVNAEFMFSEYIGPPYALCGMACMKDVFRWATKAKRQYEWPLCVFEDGDKHRKEFKQLIARLKDWPDPIFETKAKMPARLKRQI